MALSQEQVKKTRAVVVILALVCVAGIAAALVLGGPLMGAGAADDAAADTTTGTADGSASDDTTDNADVIASLDAQYGTAAQSLKDQYEADPSNPSALLNVANGYFDWGVALHNHATTQEDADRARDLLTDAVGYYDTYLEQNPDAKSAQVDRAICVFYAGDTASAIAALESLVTEDSTFAPAWANLGVFYEAADRTDDARDAYQRAIEAAGDSDPYNVKSYAQERLDALQ